MTIKKLERVFRCSLTPDQKAFWSRSQRISDTQTKRHKAVKKEEEIYHLWCKGAVAAGYEMRKPPRHRGVRSSVKFITITMPIGNVDI